MMLGAEAVDVGGALSWYGDDDGLAVVHGQRGVLDEDPDDFAGVHPADADLLPSDLDGALDADDPVHADAVGVRWWGRAGWSTTA
jgi:hypothetical protein